ncbi:hypothetical protein [Bacillus altitudinis]|uniref:hypothetical protein n=1 Tax=Bacillus altitudinis TaxID=293387 RepID=UPI0003777E51|nr:hypothetical protein [Bacillus altitudinis]QKL20265.1 hypothetical protein RI02_00780 [Bacillus altitudinis]QKL23997.1 hypothetical protein EQK04_00780 [Bacillus altitudinis]QXY94394.1 hypothetical protein G4D59_00770 [Bacillus altitudinis]
MKSKFLVKLSAFLIIGILSLNLEGTVNAYSDSSKESIPQLKGNSIQSNAWMSNTNFLQKQSFKVSAKFLGNNPPKANWVKTSYNIEANGIGVSLKGASAGSTSGNSLSGTWTNKNAWISDIAGSYKISGAPLTGSLNNTASFLARGVKRSTTASIFRLY